MENIIFEISAKSFLSWQKNTRKAFGKAGRKSKICSPMRPVAKIKPLAGGRAEAVMPAVRVAAADAGYPLPVIAASEELLANRLDPFETKLPECIGILLIIPAAEIVEMMLENLLEGVSSPRKVFGLLLF